MKIQLSVLVYFESDIIFISSNVPCSRHDIAKKCSVGIKQLIIQMHTYLKRLIDACWLILQPYLKKHIDMIENIQRRATKLIPGLSDLSYEDRLRRLKLPSMAYRRSRGDMI